jgi:flagellar basal-body rod modification protein FlgD
MDFQSIQALGATTPTTNTQTQAASGLTGDSFLTLLTAQLKSQDPTQPQDPTAFVGQLVQFNSFEQLLQIRQLLETSVSQSAGAGQAAANAVSSSTQSAQLLATA